MNKKTIIFTTNIRKYDDSFINGKVDTFSSLPDASSVSGQFWYVLNTTGIWILGTQKKKGIWFSNGTDWEYVDSPLSSSIQEAQSGVSDDSYISPFVLKNLYGNVNNTSDINKPISNATQIALDTKIETITAGTGIEVDNTNPINPVISIDDTVVTEISTNTLTNKTLDDYTNFIHADGIHLRVKATEALVKGDVVKFVGFNAGEQTIEVAKRDNINVPAIGVIHTETMATGGFGMAVSNGLFKGINTSSFADGTILYPDTSGGFTDVKPGGYAQQMAYVVRSHAVNGEIMLNVGPVYGLDKRDLYTWEYLVANWTSEPTLNTTITGGEVYNYTLNGTTRYRFVPTVYNPTQDAFYSTFSGGILSNLITKRG